MLRAYYALQTERRNDTMDIGGWLRRLGLERYEQAFRANEIDLRVLPELTTDDLKELGVAAIGHRRKLLAAIAALGERGPLPPPGTPPLAGGRPGAPLPGLVPGITGEGRVGVEAERRQLTVMFCDLV